MSRLSLGLSVYTFSLWLCNSEYFQLLRLRIQRHAGLWILFMLNYSKCAVVVYLVNKNLQWVKENKRRTGPLVVYCWGNTAVVLSSCKCSCTCIKLHFIVLLKAYMSTLVSSQCLSGEATDSQHAKITQEVKGHLREQQSCLFCVLLSCSHCY